MNVALVIPPFRAGYSHSSRSPAVTRSGTQYFPVWLAYGAGALERAGHKVLLLDAQARGLSADAAFHVVEASRPDMVVVDVALPSEDSDRAWAARFRGTRPLTIGGVAAAAFPERIRAEFPEAWIVRGDYDDALPLAVASAAERMPPRVIDASASPLDGRPFVSDVYRRHLLLDNYFYACCRHPFVPILGARGCPHACSFCVWPKSISGTKYRSRSPEDIVEELRFIRLEMPEVREVFFEDDTFNVSEDSTAARCEAIERARVNLPWSANVRPDASKELLALMKRAGCRLVLAGFESGNRDVLRENGKRIDPEMMSSFSRDARQAGLLVHGCFILGLPGDTERTMNETVDLALKLDPDTAQFYPYMQRFGGHVPLLDHEGRHAYGGSELDPQLVARMCESARHRFYGRFKFLARKGLQSLSSLDELKRNLRAFRAFLPSLVTG